MKKQLKIGALLLLTAALTSGCGMRTVDQMYQVPRRSQAYSHVQKAMDAAMTGMEYSAPISGENQQTVQLADLDGDGVDEYLLFARGKAKTPLNVLIFDTDEDENCYLMDTVSLSGSVFERVEYVDVDEKPGLELVVGCQVSDQLMGSVGIYSFSAGSAEKLMATSYSKFLTCDLNQDEHSELLVIRPSEAGASASPRAMALEYEYKKGTMERSIEIPLSAANENVKRIVEGSLEGGTPAVYISNTVDTNFADNSAIATDVLTVKDGTFVNLAADLKPVPALRNYYVYAGDIDDDGVTELPGLIPMRPVLSRDASDNQFLLCWYSMDLQGEIHKKRYTVHDYAGGWYMELDPKWATRISAEKDGNSYQFFLWDKDGTKARSLFTLYMLTGSNRDQQAVENDRFPLYRKEGIVYAVELHKAAKGYGLTEEHMINSFHLIHQAWKTGET